MENIPVQFTMPPPSYSMAPPPPLPTMAPPPLPMAPPPPPPPLSTYQQNMSSQQLSKQMSMAMQSPCTNPTWVSHDWRGPMPRPVRAFNQRAAWRSSPRFKNQSRYFPYARQSSPHNNNYPLPKKQQQGGFAVPWPPRRVKVVNKMPGKSTSGKPPSEGEGENSVKKKGKKRSMSEKYPTKPWIREDAEKALAVENKFRCLNSNNAVMIRFPDPELSKEIVRNYHPGIKSVHFQAPSGQRYCFVQLREGANVDEAIEDLNLVEFGNGKLIAERKTTMKEDDVVVTPECIDPYTLYVGNLPVSITANRLREQFPNSSRVDIGFAQKMKFTRWAFIRFDRVDLAIEAFKSAINLEFDSRSVVLRFRRATAKQLGICDQSKNVKTEKTDGEQSNSEENTSKEVKKDDSVKKEPKVESNAVDDEDEEDYEQDIENELDSVMGDGDNYTEFGEDEFDFMYNIGNEVDDDDDDDDDEEVTPFATACKMSANKSHRRTMNNVEDDDDDDDSLSYSSSPTEGGGEREDAEEDEPFLRNGRFL